MNECRGDIATCEMVYMDESLANAMADPKDPLHEKVMDAVQIFHWQIRGDIFKLTQDPSENITYYIHHWGEYDVMDRNFCFTTQRSVWRRCYCVFDNDDQFDDAMQFVRNDKPYTWRRLYDKDNPGYEVTSKGDRRFSPFFQRTRVDNEQITLEDYYKRYLKPYYEKGQKPPVSGHKLMQDYFDEHKGLMFELAIIGRFGNFTDMFDPQGGQNKWYAEMLNEYYGFK